MLCIEFKIHENLFINQNFLLLQDLGKLKINDLSNSQLLTKMLKFSSMPNLEKLILRNCRSFCKIHSSIGELKKLTLLNVNLCEKLKSFSSNIELESHEFLYLTGCQKLEKFLEIHGNMGHLKELHLDNSGIKEIPSSIEYWQLLKFFHFIDVEILTNFRIFIGDYYSKSAI